MKRICSLLLALTLVTGALLSFGGCSSSPRVEDVYDRVVELVEASYELNTVFYGAGLPVYEADSLYAEFSNMYYGFEYEGSHESVTPYSKFATVQQIRDAAELVYSKEYLEEVIYPTLFDGYVIPGMGEVKIARYLEDDEWIYEIAKSILKPDLAFFFDIPVKVAVSRVRRRPDERERYIDMDLQYKLRKEYVDICTANNGVLISTMQSENDCYAIIKNKVKEMLLYGNS